MKLVKPIKIIRQRCDGSEVEKLDINSVLYYAEQEIRESRRGELEKIHDKIDFIYSIINILIEDLNDKKAIEAILAIVSNNSDYYSYYLEEEEE